MVVKQWNRLPRQVVESPPMGIFKLRLDTTLSNLLQVTLLEQGLELDDLQVSLLTSAIL